MSNGSRLLSWLQTEALIVSSLDKNEFKGYTNSKGLNESKFSYFLFIYLFLYFYFHFFLFLFLLFLNTYHTMDRFRRQEIGDHFFLFFLENRI